MTLPVKDATGATANLETRVGTSTDLQPVHSVTLEAGLGLTTGATTDVAVTTDANGSLSAKIRGLVVHALAIITSIGATGDAAGVAGSTGSIQAKLRVLSDTLGAQGDSFIVTNTTGTVNGKLRGIVAILADIWDSTNHYFRAMLSHRVTTIVVTPALPVAGAYAFDDYIGPSTTPASIVSITQGFTGRNTVLKNVTLVDRNKQSAPLELWLFDRSIVVPLDNANWDILDTDALFCIDIIDLSSYRYTASNSVCVAKNINTVLKPNASNTIYYALVSKGTPTFATGQLQLSFGLGQD